MIPAKKTTQQSKKPSSSVGVESLSPEQSTTSGVQTTSNDSSTITPKVHTSTDPVSGVQSSVSGGQSAVTASANASSGVHTPSSDPVSGVQSSVSGVQTSAATSVNTLAGVHTPSSGVQLVSNSSNSAEIAPTLDDVPTNDDKLPDLVRTSQTETDSYSLVLDTVPPVGDLPQDNIFDGGTTEEEFDAVDALLSFSTIRDNATETSLDDNASLMPIGGNSMYQDVNQVTMHLDQVSVNGAIAKIVQEERISEAVDNDEINKEPPIEDVAGVQQNDAVECEGTEQSDPNSASVSGIQNTLSGVQTASSGVQDDDLNGKDGEPPVEDNEGNSTSTKTKGYIKVTTHGIRKKTNSDSRSYRCSV